MTPESDLPPLSGLQHLLYCERQAALIHVEGIWLENRFTAEGRVLHERVDERESESRGSVRIARGLPLRSLRLGLVGRADTVELHRLEGDAAAAAGAVIPGLDGRWRPFPVEHKRGLPKPGAYDAVQLCAQALCLGEDAGETSVPEGALFYGRRKRRTVVAFDPELRRRTEEAAARLHELVASGVTPPPVPDRRPMRALLAASRLPSPRAGALGPELPGRFSPRGPGRRGDRADLRREWLVKRHLNTLFVTTQGAYLAKEGETAVVRAEGETLLRVPLLNLDGIVCFGNVGTSPFLLGACGERGVAVSYLSSHGRFLARVVGPVSGNVRLRREQYRRADDPERAAAIARSIVLAKVINSRRVLQRSLRDRPAEGPEAASDPRPESVSALAALARRVERAGDLDAARGLEGTAARAYFAAFPALVLPDEEAFAFRGRNRRPPLDPVNALLSFVYTLLRHDVTSALEATGLDPQVGFLHRDRSGRSSLALDLMEELRAPPG